MKLNNFLKFNSKEDYSDLEYYELSDMMVNCLTCLEDNRHIHIHDERLLKVLKELVDIVSYVDRRYNLNIINFNIKKFSSDDYNNLIEYTSYLEKKAYYDLCNYKTVFYDKKYTVQDLRSMCAYFKLLDSNFNEGYKSRAHTLSEYLDGDLKYLNKLHYTTNLFDYFGREEIPHTYIIEFLNLILERELSIESEFHKKTFILKDKKNKKIFI